MLPTDQTAQNADLPLFQTLVSLLQIQVDDRESSQVDEGFLHKGVILGTLGKDIAQEHQGFPGLGLFPKGVEKGSHQHWKSTHLH